MPRRRGREPGVPTGWCIKRKARPKKFYRESFRTVCYDDDGKRVLCTDPDAVRGLTIGCPKVDEHGHRLKWNPKKKLKRFKTKGVCMRGSKPGGTRVQRVISRPGHYGCRKRRR